MMSGGGPGVLSSQIARADNSANAARSATSSSKRPRSSSGFEAHPQILAGPRPCQYSGDGSKKHRLMVAPTTSQLRNSFTSFQSTNPVGPHSECLPLGQAHSISNNQETRKESLNLRDQEKWGSEWFGYHSRTPPSTSSSANRAHTFQRSQSFAPHLASYYSTPVQSPNCLLESSASNSISSSIASHPKRQSRQLTTSYDEISTPGSVHLVEPPYAQSFYAASTPNDLFNTSLYYSNYETASKPMHFGVGLAGGLNSQGVGVVDDNCTHSVISPSNVQQSNPRIEVEKKQTQPLTYSISHNSDSRLVPSHLDSPVGNTLQSQSSIVNSKPGFPLKIRFNSYNSSLGNSGQCMGGSNQVRKGWGFHETESSGIHKRNETEDSASTSNKKKEILKGNTHIFTHTLL
ncbi:hypothetical protein BY996DRAFT_1438842 [Phakopsora pachyrhizi]|nr:hypothetical protein BY996DRAFT_1438842 [Phakopsora pachyrhizi]